MAAFTARALNDRSAFDADGEIMSFSENRLRAIVSDSRVVGTVGSYVSEGATEVTYWGDRSCWGQGIAMRALVLHLRRSRCGRSAPVPRATTPGRSEFSRRPASARSAPKWPLPTARAAEIDETILELS